MNCPPLRSGLELLLLLFARVTWGGGGGDSLLSPPSSTFLVSISISASGFETTTFPLPILRLYRLPPSCRAPNPKVCLV